MRRTPKISEAEIFASNLHSLLATKLTSRLNSKNDKFKYVILRAIYTTEEYESIMKILQDAGNTGE